MSEIRLAAVMKGALDAFLGKPTAVQNSDVLNAPSATVPQTVAPIVFQPVERVYLTGSKPADSMQIPVPGERVYLTGFRDVPTTPSPTARESFDRYNEKNGTKSKFSEEAGAEYKGFYPGRTQGWKSETSDPGEDTIKYAIGYGRR